MQSLTKNASHEGFEALWKPEFYPPLHNLHQIIFLGRTRGKNPRGRAIRLTSCRLLSLTQAFRFFLKYLFILYRSAGAKSSSYHGSMDMSLLWS